MEPTQPTPVAEPANAESPSTRKTSLGLVFIIVFIDLLGFAIVLPLLPRYAEHLHATKPEIGLLFSCFSAMQFIFSPLWGRLSDRIGRRPVLLAGLAGSVIFYALFGFASEWGSLPLMFAARIGAGIAGATIATAQAYIADATGVEGRARGMALIGAAFGVGFTFGPILGAVSVRSAAGQPANLNSLPMFLASGLSLIALIVAFINLPESLRAGTKTVAHRTWLSTAAIREAVRVPTVGSLLLMFFIATLAFGQFEATLSLLTKDVFEIKEEYNFYLFSYIGLILCIMQGVFVRRLAPKLGEPTMIIIGMVLMGSGLWLVGAAAEMKSVRMLIGIMPVLVAGFSFVTPCVQALISRRSDPSRQGEILGVNQSASSIARIIGPVLGVSLMARDYVLPYQVATALIVPALLMAVFTAGTGHDWRPAAE